MNKKIFIIIAIIIIVAIPVIAFATNRLYDRIVAINNVNAKEEKMALKNESGSQAQMEYENDVEDKSAHDDEFTNKILKFTNKILKIVENHRKDQYDSLMNKLGNNSIYDKNVSLEYENDSIIVDIVEKDNLTDEEKACLKDFLETEELNVKDDNKELADKISTALEKLKR